MLYEVYMSDIVGPLIEFAKLDYSAVATQAGENPVASQFISVIIAENPVYWKLPQTIRQKGREMFSWYYKNIIFHSNGAISWLFMLSFISFFGAI